jgi:hypothetical protein
VEGEGGEAYTESHTTKQGKGRGGGGRKSNTYTPNTPHSKHHQHHMGGKIGLDGKATAT